MVHLVGEVAKTWTQPKQYLKFRFARGIYSDTDIGTLSDPFGFAENEQPDVPDATFLVESCMDESNLLENYGVPYPAGGWFQDSEDCPVCEAGAGLGQELGRVRRVAGPLRDAVLH